MPVSHRSPIPWTRIAAESFGIVASILIAFAIDASWERRAEGQEEQAILSGLAAEFEALQDTLENWATRTRVKRDALAIGLQAAGEGPGSFGVPTLDSVFFALLNVSDWDPRGGALEAVIASGRLELISDAELRTALAGWSGMVDDLIDNQHLMQSFGLGGLVPIVSERGITMGRGWALGQEAWPVTLGDSAAARDNYRRLFSSPSIEGLLSTKYAFTASSVSDFERGVQTAREIRKMIDARRR